MNRLANLVPASLAFVLLSSIAQAQQIFVTTVADVSDFTGAHMVADLPGPDGKISLREACTAANNTPGIQSIGFHVPLGQWGTGTTGPKLINAGLSFPISSDSMTIDGTTQTAFTGDTNPNGAEVSFHSTTIDTNLIQTGIFQVKSDHNVFVGLGDMDGRNYGIDILPQGEDNTVIGCTIKAVFAAVRVQGDNNRIGGVLPGEGNSLTSLADGLRIQGLNSDSADGNRAFGNFLTGEANGVQITGNATGNQIGGFNPGERNVISGAGYFQEDGTPDGGMVRIESNGNSVLGNFIGTDATGTIAANNVGDVGVEIYGDSNVVRGNVIGGITGTVGFLSVQAGIDLREGAENNVIQGNFIGVDETGSIAIPNHLGIVVGPFDESLAAPSNNVIGGTQPGEGNLIANNEAGGVVVLLTTSGTKITGNSIRDNHANGAIGIDLGGDGVTANDHADVDVGPNGLLNSPAIDSAVVGTQGAVVLGFLGTPNPQAATIELFANPAPQPGEVVEAATFLGVAHPLPDGSFAVLVQGVSLGASITATATDASGNTSEISAGVTAVASPWTDLQSGLAGAHGIPSLAGGGPLAPNTEVGLVVSGALESTTAFLVLGPSAINAPFLGGILVPNPLLIAPLPTGPAGAVAVHGNWPGAPSGTKLFAQVLVQDPAAINGVAHSNAVVGTSP